MRKSTRVVSSGGVASYDSVSRQTIVSPVRHLARGEIYTVRYEAVNAMLLNEFLKEHRQGRRAGSDHRAATEGLRVAACSAAESL
jgi:hypothetical protein